MEYKHIFFDLDKTLWDFDTNTNEALTEIYNEYKLEGKGISSCGIFINAYKKHNDRLWSDYSKNLINKAFLRVHRFYVTLQDFKINDAALAEAIAAEYVARSPYKKALYPFTTEVLDYLSKKYALHIITNGFDEVQHIKLKHSGIHSFFKEVVTSERAGFKKPEKGIFDYALIQTKALAPECVMVGDNFEIDILGAKAAGLHQVYFNPQKTEGNYGTHTEINCLSELLRLL